MQEITRQDFLAAKAAMPQDTSDQGVLRIEAVGEADKADAARLLEPYGLTQELRTLDALHLAAVRRLGHEGLDAINCADRRPIAILEAKGLTVINPETV